MECLTAGCSWWMERKMIFVRRGVEVYMVSGVYETFIYLARQHKPAGGASHYITNPQSRGQPAGQGPARCLSSFHLRQFLERPGKWPRSTKSRQNWRNWRNLLCVCCSGGEPIRGSSKKYLAGLQTCGRKMAEVTRTGQGAVVSPRGHVRLEVQRSDAGC